MKINPMKLFAVMPLLMQLVELVLQIAAAMGWQNAATIEAEAIDAQAAVGAPEPPNVEYLPLSNIYLFPETTGNYFDPTAKFRKEWADVHAEPDDPEMGTITYPLTFRGLVDGEPVFRPLTISVDEARRTNAPQPSSGTVDNRPYRPFPCRPLYWWERIELAPGGVGGIYRIRNVAFRPPDEQKAEFTVGDRRMIVEIHRKVVEG